MLVVVQIDPLVPPGLLLDLIQGGDLPFRLVTLFADDHSLGFEDALAVIVLGGTMSVGDTIEFPFLLSLKEFIQAVVHRGIPYLGICLGGQLLAEVLGGTVHLGKRGEKGCHQISLTEAGITDPLFSGMPEHFISFQWHGDCFDPPPGTVHLAWSAACPYQAFRHGQTAYGIQFHPEVTWGTVLAWSSEEGDQQMAITKGFEAVAHAYREVSLKFLGNFLQLIRAKD